MPFDDKDLERVKNLPVPYGTIRKDIEGLIERLEAAEKAIEPRCSMYCGNCECAEDYKAWLKSKGEK